MEHRTETYLENQIQVWKRTFAKRSEISKDNLEELESHLRDEIQLLKSEGLSEMEAFLVARHRLGDEECLAEEYKKVNPFNHLFNKLKPYILGALGVIALRDVHEMLNTIFSVVAARLGYVDFSIGVTIIVSILLIGVLSVSIQHIYLKQVKFSFPKWLVVLLFVPIVNLITKIVIAKYVIDDIGMLGIIYRNKVYVVSVMYVLVALVLIGILLSNHIRKRKNLKVES